MNIRNEMITNAKGHNNCLTNEYLDQFSNEQLLAFTHPIDREHYCKRLKISYEKWRHKESLNAVK